MEFCSPQALLFHYLSLLSTVQYLLLFMYTKSLEKYGKKLRQALFFKVSKGHQETLTSFPFYWSGRNGMGSWGRDVRGEGYVRGNRVTSTLL